ncbi:conserved hypothetical protein [Culex quinquefasciatus]|uniref:Uncharacterized protein n=1 Tax=Culex quinquefasciatus TaxID=7176 RepID=B0WIF9_CULQU|nr:conserved hypothetical protein [Culex quinquefasciatus]|eukprot:XP_001848493.1 conserved hypothetical protein [Culex quinquefasciatus]
MIDVIQSLALHLQALAGACTANIVVADSNLATLVSDALITSFPSYFRLLGTTMTPTIGAPDSYGRLMNFTADPNGVELLWQTVFGLPARQQDIPTVKRTMLQMLSVLKFVLLESYSTKLLMYVLNNLYEPQHRTVAEFNEGSFPVRIYRNEMVISVARLHWSDDRLIFDSEERPHNYDIPNNQSYLMHCDIAQVFVESSYNIDQHSGLRKFYVLEETITWILYSHVFTPLNPLVMMYSMVNDWIFAAGIWNHWIVRTTAKLDEVEGWYSLPCKSSKPGTPVENRCSKVMPGPVV